MFSKLAFSAIVIANLAACTSAPRQVPLLSEDSFEGWTVKSLLGDLKNYQIKDGVVTATSPQGADSFLCSDKSYRNFELELEFKLDEKDGVYMNSGIQLRSCVKKDPKGRDSITGWQCEIDPSSRAWTAGIYEEGQGRGWLQPKKNAGMEGKFAGGQNFRHGEWNHLRIVCEGPRVRTWLNHSPAVDLVDPQGATEGFIALQAHNGPPGRTYHFRKIHITELP
ncbi:MAG: hypothetical protein RL095_2407 [Verrucomicrobiota bacterium]